MCPTSCPEQSEGWQSPCFLGVCSVVIWFVLPAH